VGQLDGFRPVGGAGHLKALLLQIEAGQLADGLLVVDDQDEGSGCREYPLLAH
jgi:hypothetical protein